MRKPVSAMRTAAVGLLTGVIVGIGVPALADGDCDGCHRQDQGQSQGQPQGQPHGQLLDHHVAVQLDATALAKLLASNSEGQQLARIAGAPACGVEIVYYRYRTTGGAGEPTEASGALMLPTGRAAACAGPRPLMIYAHGTTAYRNYNLADITQTDPLNADGAGEGLSVAAMYAAQGYIVVASNYAGLGGSDLPYHPYLNAAQQSTDVIDSLRATRALLHGMESSRHSRENGKLFVTGYSQGGFVAMATHRALQAAGVTVTAAAPGSGPYAIAATADALIEGEVNLGSTLFAVLTVTSYQRAYGNLYRRPGDFYDALYAPGIETLLPSVTPLNTLFAQNKLPSTKLFSKTPPAPQFASVTPLAAPPETPPALAPLFASGFGSPHLVRNAYRLTLLEDATTNPDGAFPSTTAALLPAANPQSPLRQAFKRNDLRNWSPRAPVLLCGGNSDPTVFFFNALIEQAYWKSVNVPAGLTSVLDVDSPVGGPNDPYASIKQGFAGAKANVASQAVAAGATDGGTSAVIQAYHGELVAAFCMAAARGFFDSF